MQDFKPLTPLIRLS